MDFQHSDRSLALQAEVQAFLDERVFPAEAVFERQAADARAAGAPFHPPAVLEDLKKSARERGLWNLFLPDERYGAALSVLDYAPIAELSGRAPAIAPEAMNCSAPDTGNMELLSMFASEEQVQLWLRPLLDGDIRSCFSMTEPAVASSDASTIATSIMRDGEGYVIRGRKWWSSGAMRPDCTFAIVLGVSDPDAPRHQRHSMVLVPLDTPGVVRTESTSVFGYDDGPHGGHAVIDFHDVRVPADHLLGTEGAGFAMAQARLGPGRIHHCMRSLGMAERALELLCRRAATRSAFGGPLADQGVVREWAAEARVAIDQARLLVLHTAWLIDRVGARAARREIASIKVAAPRAALYTLDKAIQVHGGAGVSAHTPLAAMWAQLRTLRIADGPDEVHLRTIGRVEMSRHIQPSHPPTRQAESTLHHGAQAG